MTTNTRSNTRGPFAPIVGARAILLTTFRRDGTPVGTPVNVAGDDDVAYFRTYDPSGKLKRIRHNPDVEVAPCTLRGRVVGESRLARARVLSGDESDAVARALARKHPVLHRFLVPWAHRLRGYTTVHLELTPR